MQELPLNGFYSSESRKLTDRRCINWVPTLSDNGSLSAFSLMPSSGIEYLDNVGLVWSSEYGDGKITGQVGAFDGFNSLTQFHVGRRIIGYNGVLGTTKLLPATPIVGGGTITSSSAYSRFASNGTDLVSVAPSSYNSNQDRVYKYDDSLTPTAVDVATALNTNTANIVDLAYLGARFLYLCAQKSSNPAFNFNRVHYSGLGGIAPNTLDFFTPQGNDEQLKGLEVLNDHLYLFAETQTFIYRVTESTDIPYQEVGTMEYGLDGTASAPQAKCKYKGTIAFYGRQKNGPTRIYLLSGSGAQAISTKDVDRIIAQETNNIRLFAFTEKGREFLCVRSDTVCFVFEAETGIWHERKTYPENSWQFVGATENASGTGSVMIGAEFKETSIGRLFTGSGVHNPVLGTEVASPNNESNESGIVNREMISSPFNGKNDKIILAELQPQCEVDFSMPDSGWSKPEINISVSYDFGNTFEKERSLNIGSIGDYKATTRFFNFGYVTQAFTVKLRAMNPYPTRVLTLLARTEKGYS